MGNNEEVNKDDVTKEELLESVNDMMNTGIMKEVITFEELEQILIILAPAMNRGIDRAKKIMMGE